MLHLNSSHLNIGLWGNFTFFIWIVSIFLALWQSLTYMMSSQSFLWKWLDSIVSWLFLVLAWVTQDLLSAFLGCIILHWAVVRLLLGQQCWCLHPSSKGCWDEAGYSLAHPLLSQLFTFIESAFCPANWASSASMTHHRPKWVLYYSGSWHQLVKSQKSKWRRQQHKK